MQFRGDCGILEISSCEVKSDWSGLFDVPGLEFQPVMIGRRYMYNYLLWKTKNRY
jgi:hypothetical protein